MSDTDLHAHDPRVGVVPQRCPGCRGYLNAMEDADGNERPKPGDRSFCIWCGQGLVLLEGGTLRAMTADELADTIAHLTPEEKVVVAAMNARRLGKAGRFRGRL